VKARFSEAPIIVGIHEAALLTDANLNLSAPFGMPILSPPPDRTVNEGDVLDLAGFHLEVFEIPGHSPGHIVFLIRGTPNVVLGGDVLFRGSIGRTDFPGGSFERLESGIHAKLFTLPDDTLVYPGHGPVTTVGHEKRTNPFVAQKGS
jgi:glyoxylase-like metal-dependent hydrolase (beta-lactamase superfamily II)